MTRRAYASYESPQNRTGSCDLCLSGQIAEQDGDMLRALLEQVARERADMNASARTDEREDVEHACCES
jgi:hypothetical protein